MGRTCILQGAPKQMCQNWFIVPMLGVPCIKQIKLYFFRTSHVCRDSRRLTAANNTYYIAHMTSLYLSQCPNRRKTNVLAHVTPFRFHSESLNAFSREIEGLPPLNVFDTFPQVLLYLRDSHFYFYLSHHLAPVMI